MPNPDPRSHLSKSRLSSVADWLMQLPKKMKTGINRYWFMACLSLIVGVSIYDSYLVVLYRDSILDDERNPICLLLIRKDPIQLSWFLLGKAFGNVGVVGVLSALYRFEYQRVMTVAVSVALFQFWLFVFLNFADPLTGFLHFDGLLSPDPKQFSQGLRSAIFHGVVTVGFAVVWILLRLGWKSIRNSARVLGPT